MSLKCECGKTVEDWRGARGHTKFKTGGIHGEPMQMPDDWRSLFSEVDPETDGAEDVDEQDDTPDPEPDEDDGADEQAAGSPQAPASDEADTPTEDRLRKAWHEDVRHLWRDDL